MASFEVNGKGMKSFVIKFLRVLLHNISTFSVV